jgi:hypothetical protein
MHLMLRLPSTVDDTAIAGKAWHARRILVPALASFWVGAEHGRGLVVG